MVALLIKKHCNDYNSRTHLECVVNQVRTFAKKIITILAPTWSASFFQFFSKFRIKNYNSRTHLECVCKITQKVASESYILLCKYIN